MATSSSTKRAAKMAQRGKGRKVRFQNGTTFPLILALILISGVVLVGFSRHLASTPVDATPPQPPSSWEMSYGFNLCGKWYQFSEPASTADKPAFKRFEKYGIDSQGDGLIYLNVTEENAGSIAGKRAILQRFFDVYGATVTDDKVTFSPDYLPKAVDGDKGAAEKEYSEADLKCDGKRAEIAVRVWNSPSATKSQRYIAKVGRIRFTQPAMVFAIYFDDPNAEQAQPPSVATLKAHIEAAKPTPATSVPGEGTVAPGTETPSTGTAGAQTDGSTTGSTPGSTPTSTTLFEIETVPPGGKPDTGSSTS